MGWQDREYARPTSPHGPTWQAGPVIRPRGRSIVTILIIINAAIFVLCIVTGPAGLLYESPIFMFGAMHTPSVLHGQIWRLVTADYLHWSFWHIFMNMLALHFLGRPLERDWGAKRFFTVYFVAGILGSVFYMILTQIGWLSINGVAAGASGCVLALLGACAVRYPHAQVYIYFLFPIKIRTAALIFGGWYVLNLFQRGNNAGGDACHLAGLLFGAWWVWKGDAWWSQTRWGLPSLRPGPRQTRAHKKKSGGFADSLAQRRADAETIDTILRKVYDGGIHSLTEAEKKALAAATERQRQRDAEADRL